MEPKTHKFLLKNILKIMIANKKVTTNKTKKNNSNDQNKILYKFYLI